MGRWFLLVAFGSYLCESPDTSHQSTKHKLLEEGAEGVQSFDIVLTPLNATDQEVPPEDPAPSASKVRRDEATGDFVVADVSGLRLSVRWRLDNRGYDVASSEFTLSACSLCDMQVAMCHIALWTPRLNRC